MIFDGKKFAKEIESKVKCELRIMNYGMKPKIVSILVGNDPASELYTRLKKTAAERCGIDFLIERLDARSQMLVIKQKIVDLAEREDVTGIMVQLPLPDDFKGETLKVLEEIPLAKDVDGLRWRESGVKPATVRAVLAILEKISDTNLWHKKFVVLGSQGAVGEPLVYFLKQRGVKVTELEWDTPEPTRRVLEGDVVISCVGKAGLVTTRMVRSNLIAIDVGMSQKDGKVVGDMTTEVYQKASIAVPVPGGVGPVTIASLLQNATDICQTMRK